MAKGIAIGIASETKAFKMGIETGMIAPLEDAVDQLAEIGRSRGPEQLEKGLKQAQTASEKLQKETKQTADTIEREFRTAYRNMAQSADSNLDRARNATRSLKDEARQNFAEVASSFDGTMQGVADGIQGTLGGAAIAVGGLAGLALGALGAIAGSVLNQITTTTEESKGRVADMYDDMAKSRSEFFSEEFVVSAIQDQVRDNYDRIAEIARLTGQTEADVARAMVTAGDERNAVLSAANAAYQDQLALVSRVNTDANKTNDINSGLAASYAGIVSELSGYNTEQGTAIDKVNLFKEATSTAVDTAIDKVSDLKTATETFKPITITADTAAADKAITDWTGKSRKIRLELEGYLKDGRRAI